MAADQVMSEYRVFYYQNSKNQRVPVKEYVDALSVKDKAKVFTYIELLRDKQNKAAVQL